MKTVINNIGIKSVAAWLPVNKLEMSSLGPVYGEVEVANIIKATGVERVRIADETMTSSDMCQYATEYLFEVDGIDKDIIDGLVFVSQTTDYILPATSISLQHRLGLSQDTICIDIHYGCSGYIYGLFQAACWISSGMCSNVLVLAGDTTSRMINPKDKSLRMVFGDCGTATLVGKAILSWGSTSNLMAVGPTVLLYLLVAFVHPLLLKHQCWSMTKTITDVLVTTFTWMVWPSSILLLLKCIKISILCSKL